MATLNSTQHFCIFSKLLLVLVLILLFFSSSFISAHSQNSNARKILEQDIDDDDSSKPIKKKSISNSKNQTKLAKISSFSSYGSIKNQTKLAKTKLSFSDSLSSSTKNKTKPTPQEKISLKSQIKKLNSTSSNVTKKSSYLSKTIKMTPTKDLNESKTIKTQSLTDKNFKKESTQKYSKPNWLEDDEDGLISGFKDLPSKFQETLLPDLEKISKTSQVYLNKANKEITKNFKPIVGHKYASTIAPIVSFSFILIPLVFVSLIFNKIKAYFSLQRLLIFIQVYLSIYFFILCLSSLLTGLEPLKFFYATSQSTYICLQLMQTLAYVLYLLMLLMYLVLVFSTETGPVTKVIGLAQTFVGFGVGLHYYVMVFHRAVLRQPPKTSWRVHGIYATCFFVICLLSRAERIKKTYLEEGGEEGKRS